MHQKQHSFHKHTAANVRDALAFVSRGEALLGVVFGTDAAADKNVTVVAEFPENTHNDISYPVAVIKDNSNQEVKKLYNFLISDEAADYPNILIL